MTPTSAVKAMAMLKSFMYADLKSLNYGGFILLSHSGKKLPSSMFYRFVTST